MSASTAIMDNPEEAVIEWSSWPWQTCPARTIDAHGRCRCDLRKGHDGDHRADRGMYDVVWSPEYRMVGR